MFDRNTGTPYVVEQKDTMSDLYIAFKVSFDEIKSLMSERNQNEYKDINESNWYMYTILQEGQRMMIYYNTRGDGRYHDEARLEIGVGKDGYSISYEEISPMGGGYSSKDTLPFGFFRGKSLSEVEKCFRNYGKYIDPSNIKLGCGDYSRLIRTDEYYSN